VFSRLVPYAVLCMCVLLAESPTAAADVLGELAPGAKADPEFLDIYLAELANDQEGYYAAIKLADLGPVVVPRVLGRLRSGDPVVRKWAARTLTDLGAEKAAAGRNAIVQALAAERDEHALWYLVQAADVLRPQPVDVVPEFIKLLGHSSVDLRRTTAEALGNIGQQAAVAKAPLIAALSAAPDNWLQSTIVQSLHQIGLDATDARLLARVRLPDDSEGARDVFRELVRAYPEEAMALVQDHPHLLESMPVNDLALIDLFARADAESNALRAFLGGRPDLPQFVRVNYAKGERIGHVMTWPRQVDPTACFPQRLAVVRVELERVALDSVKADPDYRLWEAEGLVILVIGDKYGFADAATGRVVIEPRFSDAQNFSDNRAVIVLDDKYGYIDKTGKLIVPATFDWGYAFQKGTAAVKQHGKFGLIDVEGRWVKEPTYKLIDPAGTGWRAWTFDGLEGTLDAKGEMISPMKSRD
jgi:hypothetical protein